MTRTSREVLAATKRDDLIAIAQEQGYVVATSITKAQLLDLLAPEGVEAAGNGDAAPRDAAHNEGAPGHSAASTIEFTVEDERTLHERVLAVFAGMPAIEKSGTAPGNMGGYSFRRVEDITAALKPLLAKEGVVIVPTILDRRSAERTTANNKSLWTEDLLIEFRFIDWQGETLIATMWGQGTDSGDKAVQKAVTSAFKSMLSVTFCITDQADDSEAHDVPESAPKPSEDDLAREAGWDDAEAEGQAHVALSRRIKELRPEDVEKARTMRMEHGWPVRPRTKFLGFTKWVAACEKAMADEMAGSSTDPDQLAAARAALAQAEQTVAGKAMQPHGGSGETINAPLLNGTEAACDTCGGTGSSESNIIHEPGCPNEPVL